MTQINNSAGKCPFSAVHPPSATPQPTAVNSVKPAQPSMQRAVDLVPADVSVARPNVDAIPCPALAAMHTAGLLPANDGQVNNATLDQGLALMGLSKGVRRVLVRGADATTDNKGSFGLFALNGSSLDHTGSTFIRQDGVHPQAFGSLAQFANERGELGSKEFARAAKFFAKQDPGFKGAATQMLEFAALLEVFGRPGAHGPHLSVADAKALFVESRFPDAWQAKGENSIGFAKVLGRTVVMAWHRLFSAAVH